MEKELKFVPELKIDYLFLIQELMLEHHISCDEVLYLFARMHNVEWTINANSFLSLVNKHLISTDKVVNTGILFRRYEEKQLEIELVFESSAKTNDKSEKLAKNLWDKFVDEKVYTEEKLKTIASMYFRGDATIAKYFTIFMNIFPQRSLKRNSKWNSTFGIVFEGNNRQEWSVRVAKKFQKIYSRKDIDPGILLSAAFMYVSDSIDSSGEAFVGKPMTFFNVVDYWYEIAEEDFNSHKNKQSKNISLQI